MDALEARLAQQSSAVKAAELAPAPDSASEWGGSAAFAALRGELLVSSEALEKAAARFAVMCADAGDTSEAMVLAIGAAVVNACERVVAAMLGCAPLSAQNLRQAQGRAVSAAIDGTVALLRAAMQGPHYLPQLAGVVLEACEKVRGTPTSNKVAVKREAMRHCGTARDTAREFDDLLQAAEAAAAAAAAVQEQEKEEEEGGAAAAAAAAAKEEAEVAKAAATAAVQQEYGGFEEDDEFDDFDEEMDPSDICAGDRARLKRGVRFIRFVELATKYLVQEMSALPAAGAGADVACAWAEAALVHGKRLADEATEVGMALYPPHEPAGLLEVVRAGHAAFTAALDHLLLSPAAGGEARLARETDWALARTEAEKQVARLAEIGDGDGEGAAAGGGDGGGGGAAVAPGVQEATAAMAAATLAAVPPAAPTPS
jgi:hypothetical protein